jgi:hypothetical protein
MRIRIKARAMAFFEPSPRQVYACRRAPSPHGSPRRAGEQAQHSAPHAVAMNQATTNAPQTRYRTASITLPTFAKISSISSSLTIRGGLSAMVSPVTRIMTPWSWNAFSMAA